VLLVGKFPAPHSPVVDHVIPHRGDPRLFWDEANLQAVSKVYHDSVKQAQERGAAGIVFYPGWLRPSRVPLTIVCGPPAAGKSTYVQARAGANDLVIDVDQIAAGLAGSALHAWDGDRWLAPAIYLRNDALGKLAGATASAAWFITTAASAKAREWWAAKLRPMAMVVLETPVSDCVANAEKDCDRDQQKTAEAIAAWWWSYTPRHGDVVVRPIRQTTGRGTPA
jgi:hypothetical protein